MRFRNMEVFHAVMQHGSVSAAANHLHISQPSATKLLKQAEEQLGYELFDRVRGRLYPTDEARALFKEVRRAYDALEAVRSLGQKLGGNFVGHFRVAAPPALALELLPEAIAQFCTRYRTVSIEVSTQHSGDILGANSRLSAQFDLGFTFGAQAAPGLNVVELGRVPIMCAVSRSLLKDPGQSIALSDIAGLPFIQLDESEPLGSFILEHAKAKGIDLDSAIRAHAHHVAVALAARRMGVAVIDWFTARFYADKAVAADLLILPLDPPSTLPVTAVYYATEGFPLPAREFVQSVREALAASGAEINDLSEQA